MVRPITESSIGFGSDNEAMNGQEYQYSDAYKSEVDFILRNPTLDNLKKQQLIESI